MLIYDSGHPIRSTSADIDFIGRTQGSRDYVSVLVAPATKPLEVRHCPDGWDEVEVPEMNIAEIKKALAKVNGVDPSKIHLVPR